MGCVNSTEHRGDSERVVEKTESVTSHEVVEQKPLALPLSPVDPVDDNNEILDESQVSATQNLPSIKTLEPASGRTPASSVPNTPKTPKTPTTPLRHDPNRDTVWPAWLMQYAPETAEGWWPRKIATYQKIEKIGQGTYSSVYKAVDLTNGQTVALKKVKADGMDEDSITFLAREINILRKMDHPNILKLLDVATTPEHATIFIVFEYLEHDLAGLTVMHKEKFNQAQIKHFMSQILGALDHCHQNGVMHRDVKGSNMLLDTAGNLKLGDFGLAIQPIRLQPLTNRVITLWYRPPELLLGATQYTTAVDIWSAGCIFAELFHGKPILPGRTEVEQLHQIYKLCGSQGMDDLQENVPYGLLLPPTTMYPRRVLDQFSNIPPDALEVIDKMLSIRPKDRGTAAEHLSSSYFTNNPPPTPCLPQVATSHEYSVKRAQSRNSHMQNPARKNVPPDLGDGMKGPGPGVQYSAASSKNLVGGGGGGGGGTSSSTKPSSGSMLTLSPMGPQPAPEPKSKVLIDRKKPEGGKKPEQRRNSLFSFGFNLYGGGGGAAEKKLAAKVKMSPHKAMTRSSTMGKGTYTDESLFERQKWMKSQPSESLDHSVGASTSGLSSHESAKGMQRFHTKPRISESIVRRNAK